MAACRREASPRSNPFGVDITITLPPVDRDAIQADQKSSSASMYAASSNISMVGVYPRKASFDVATAFTSHPFVNLKCRCEFFSLENVTPIHFGHWSTNDLTLFAISTAVSSLFAIISIFSGFSLRANTNFLDAQADVTVDTPACLYFNAMFSSHSS